MERQIGDLQAQAQRVESERDQAQRQHEGKAGAQSQWEEKCKALEAEVAALKDQVAKSKVPAKPKNNFAIDEI
jgi:phage host-nuclease inhibitor protein Gam